MNSNNTIKDVIAKLNVWAPQAYQEEYDNSGLIAGDANAPVTGVLVSLDCTEAVVQEAIDAGCNLIVSHHPIVFKGLKKLTGKNYVERTVIKAIKHDVALFAIHTNLDHVPTGVNKRIGDLLGISKPRILRPKEDTLNKLVAFVPSSHVNEVSQALFDAGAGSIGDYDSCSFRTKGVGTFRGGEDSNPFVGVPGSRHEEEEEMVSVVVPNHLLGNVVSSLMAVHPYEEPAFDVLPMKNSNHVLGSGMIGELRTPEEINAFLKRIKATFNCGSIRHTAPVKDTVQRIAWCGGSGSFLLGDAKSAGADVFITGDFKYHEFFDADGSLVIADIGHFESEQFTKELIHEFLERNFSTFAIRLSEVNTNPIHYL
jgi:dinuclear metal center YbgI/SA1388 family protein